MEKTVNSPCIRNCCLNKDDVCLGCFRHVDEIVEWGQAGSQRRKVILENSKKRRADHQLKWGGCLPD